jgi:ABC-2 type transport system permease protein
MNPFSPRLRAQIYKELLSVLRDPRARAILIGPPLMQLLLFSFAVTLEVRNASIAVYDRDGGPWSHELVARVAAAGFVDKLHTVQNPEQLHQLLEQRRVLLAIEIPESFSRELTIGRPVSIQVIADGRRANSGQVALSYLERIAAGLGPGARISGGAAPEPAAVRHWFNPNLNYQWFVVPGLAGILAMFSALIVTSLSIAREREMGTFDQLLVSPTTPMEIIAAKMLPALIIGTCLGMMMVAAGVFGFRVPFTGSLLLLILSMMLFILSIVGIGLMISSLCATQQQAFLGSFATGVPMILMSGFATPVENMPPVLQWIAEALPLRHFLVILEGTFLKSLPAAEVMARAWPMAAIALVTLSAATILVKRRLQ